MATVGDGSSQLSSADLPSGSLSRLHPFFLLSLSGAKAAPDVLYLERKPHCAGGAVTLWAGFGSGFSYTLLGRKAPKKQFKDPVNNPQTNKSALLVSTVFLSSVSPFSVIRK